MSRNVWLLYLSKYESEPAMVFADKEDARIVCEAINTSRGVDEGDMYCAHVHVMPLVGGER